MRSSAFGPSTSPHHSKNLVVRRTHRAPAVPIADTEIQVAIRRERHRPDAPDHPVEQRFLTHPPPATAGLSRDNDPPQVLAAQRAEKQVAAPLRKVCAVV